ncbi:MAG: prepilin-type N-terminal cleavage/methylation domain-containing protein [Desulfuromonadales bacterium]|nr:prepilin-type N-terminal cleavage/methylation domain-containing protein [Desulfuromonadales bacterium]
MRKLLIKNQRGFSLIEAMIAMVILSIGLMAVGLMQIGAMKANANAFSRSDGVVMAQSVMDTLRCLPLDDDLLVDTGTAIDAGKAVGGVFNDALADQSLGNVVGSNGQNYTIFWNVVDDTLTNSKTVRLFVYWTDQSGLNRTIVTSVLGGLYL